ncbi:MAG TPA: penicillin-binding protein activator [Gammaproteobacteria bacterium]
MSNDKPTSVRVSRLRALGVLAAAAWLAAGCVSTPTSAPSPQTVALERRARAAEERGDAASAMQLYRQLADTTRGTQRVGYLIDAARLALTVGDASAATGWLTEAEEDANAAQRQAIVVLRAELDLRDGRANDALVRLDGLGRPGSIALMTDAESVRGRALFALGRASEAVRTLVEREAWLETSEAILDNQRMIWDGLASSGDVDLRPTGDALVDGWLALAPIAASGASGPELRGALVEWRRQHASHPAVMGLLADLLATDRGSGAYPEQIALLLPISSPQRAFAIAIRDGFLAAHLAAGGGSGDITIRVYDTAQLGAEEAYRRAQLEGASFIVGPLLGPEVSRIVPQAGLVPTLALNFTDADTSAVSDFWQFALAPEDETRAIARRAYADGARTAIALVPIDSAGWGLRLLNSFRAEFEALGGRVLEYETYDRSARDFSAPIEALLNLDLSEQRNTELERALGMNLAFEPRRRQDADMIFLAAPDRATARLLAPALRLYLTGGEPLPVYANTDVHEPADAARDGDLNDIVFPDAPWLLAPDPRGTELRRTLQSYWPQRASGGILRFYGMGVDAYRLVGALYAGAYSWPLDGLSGQLELGPDGRIRRSLPFAQFQNGRAVALQPLPPGRIAPEEGSELGGFVGAR